MERKQREEERHFHWNRKKTTLRSVFAFLPARACVFITERYRKAPLFLDLLFLPFGRVATKGGRFTMQKGVTSQHLVARSCLSTRRDRTFEIDHLVCILIHSDTLLTADELISVFKTKFH